MKVFILFLWMLLSVMLSTKLDAQTISRSVIGATGSVHPQLSSTTGEVAIATGTAAGSIFTQGFQQPDAFTGGEGSFCNLPAVHFINADTLTNGTYRAANSITIQGGSLQNGDDVGLAAGNQIQFLPGFSAQAGSKLYAYIEACTETISSIQEAEKPEVQEIANSFDQQEIQLRAFPNPFREHTTIEYYLPEAGPVFLFLTDLNGRRIARLENGVDKEQGPQQVIFHDGELQAGMYLLVLRTKTGGLTEKLVFLQ